MSRRALPCPIDQETALDGIVPLRGHHRQQRRRAIIAIARRLFVERGYERTTMSSVAAKLGGSKTTLWSYFQNKEELHAAVIQDIIADGFPSFGPRHLPKNGSIDATQDHFVEYILSFCDDFLAYLLQPDVLQLIRFQLGETSTPGLSTVFQEQILPFARKKLIDIVSTAMPRPEATELAAVTLNCVLGLFTVSLLTGQNTDELRSSLPSLIRGFASR